MTLRVMDKKAGTRLEAIDTLLFNLDDDIDASLNINPPDKLANRIKTLESNIDDIRNELMTKHNKRNKSAGRSILSGNDEELLRDYKEVLDQNAGED